MSAIDGLVGRLDADGYRRFVILVAEEILTRRPDSREQLEEHLSRHGWTPYKKGICTMTIYYLTMSFGDFQSSQVDIEIDGAFDSEVLQDENGRETVRLGLTEEQFDVAKCFLDRDGYSYK